MNLKKMILLASMAMAAMAFGAPAAQASLDWSSPGTIQGTGSLTTVGLWTTGPMTIHFEGEVEGTEGQITEFEITGPTVPMIGVPGCHAKPTVNKNSLPWKVDLKTADTMIITKATYMYDYTNCPPPTVGEVPVLGDVTLTIEKKQGTNEYRCADANPYNDSTTMFIEGTTIGVDIEGTVCWTGSTVTGI